MTRRDSPMKLGTLLLAPNKPSKANVRFGSHEGWSMTVNIPILRIEPRDSLPAYLHAYILQHILIYLHCMTTHTHSYVPPYVPLTLAYILYIPAPSSQSHPTEPRPQYLPQALRRTLTGCTSPPEQQTIHTYKLSKQCCLSSASHRPRHSHLSRESAAVHTTVGLLASTFLLSLWRNNVQPGE